MFRLGKNVNMEMSMHIHEKHSTRGIKAGLCKVRMRTADADGGRRMADGGRTKKKKENN